MNIRGNHKCYACDAKATGICDRTYHVEGGLVPACDRHRSDYHPDKKCQKARLDASTR